MSTNHSFFKYGLAIAAPVTALLLMLSLDPLIHLTQASFLLFFGAVTLTALYGGRNPGIVATVLSAIFANYFFLPPQYSWTLDLASSTRVFLFFLQGILISFLVGALRDAQAQTQRSLEQLQVSELEIKGLNQELQRQVDELTQAERMLRTSEERLHVAVKNSPIAVFNQDQDLVYTWIHNPAFDQQIQDIVGKRDADLLSEQDAIVLNRIKSNVLKTGIGVREEVKLTVDGKEYYYDLTVEPLRNNQDDVTGITCAAIDVTQRKQAEEALRYSEQRFRRLVESNMFGVAFSHASGEMYYANDYFLDMVGYTHEDLLKGKLRWLNMTPPEFLHLDEQAAKEIQETGVATPFEKEYIRKDGSRVPILIGVASHADSIRQEKGTICFYIDLTERKQVEAAWQEGKQILDAILEYIPEGITIADAPDVKICMVSQHGQQLAGRPLELVEGAPASTHVDDWGIFRADGITRPTENEIPLTRAVRQSEVVVNEEWVIERPDGSKISILCNAGPIKDDQGKTTGGILAWRDITEWKQAEKEREQLLERERAARTEAEAANRVKDEFLAVLSHELRSPLNPILGWARLLQTKKLDEAKVTQALQIIERNARLQAELIEDLLDVSRILRGKLSLNLGAVDLTTTIQAAIETVRLSAEAKAIDLQFVISNFGLAEKFDSQFKLQNPKFQVLGDAARLQQIIWNLLSNAVKFTPRGGRVEVKLESVRGRKIEGAEGQAGESVGTWGNAVYFSPTLTSSYLPLYAQITVTDTGKGISSDFLPYVFEYFRQADSTITRKFGGLGLGLAIVRHLVELHGGTIQVESEGEGLGATFTVRLPSMVSSLPRSQDGNVRESFPSFDGIKVLVVDDDTDAREFVAFVLEQERATVITAASADEALTVLADVQPDVLLSDIGMPEIDGYTLMQKVRSLPPEQGGSIPAIALTAYAGEYDQRQALKVGFQQHMAKPVEPEALVRAISELIHSEQQHSEQPG